MKRKRERGNLLNSWRLSK